MLMLKFYGPTSPFLSLKSLSINVEAKRKTKVVDLLTKGLIFTSLNLIASREMQRK